MNLTKGPTTVSFTAPSNDRNVLCEGREVTLTPNRDRMSCLIPIKERKW